MLKIDLPVSDVIGLTDQSRVRFFLDANPLNPLGAQVLRASYRAKDVPGVGLVYEIVAVLDRQNNKAENKEHKTPRIGLRGYGSNFRREGVSWILFVP